MIDNRWDKMISLISKIPSGGVEIAKQILIRDDPENVQDWIERECHKSKTSSLQREYM